MRQLHKTIYQDGEMQNMNKRASEVKRWLSIGLMALGLAGCGQFSAHERNIALATAYAAVMIDNGQVFFGKLDQTHPGYLLLTDAFFVVSGMNPDTHQVTNTLSKLDKQLHAPDRMYINLRHVVAVEPVADNSQIGTAIKNIQERK